jgi:hypothetical protein
VLRMACPLADLARRRVLRLGPERLAEYLELTGRHAARRAQPPPPRPPGVLARAFLRGVLLLATSGRLQAEQVPRGRRRLRLMRVALHLHGLAPASGDLDRRAARRARLDLANPTLHAIVTQVLRVTIEGLGSGSVPLLTEVSRGVALLNAAVALAAGRRPDGRVAAEDLVATIPETADLLHAPPRSTAGRFLGTFASDAGPLFLFASGHPL